LLLCLLYAGANKNVVLKGGDLSEVAANAELSTSSSMRVPALRLGLGEIGAITRIRRCIGESSKGLGCRELPLIASMRYDWDWAVTCQAPYWNEVESRRSAPTGVESLPAQSGRWCSLPRRTVPSPMWTLCSLSKVGAYSGSTRAGPLEKQASRQVRTGTSAVGRGPRTRS
jgi:hypothetical protein